MHLVAPGELSEYAGNLEPFINQIPDYALCMLDTSGRVMSWNVGAERLKGYTAQEILGRDFSVFYTKEDLAMGKPHRALDIASQEGTYQDEGLRVRKDGSSFWAIVTITALKDTEGKLRGFAKLTRDITERKMHEAILLAAKEAKYRALFENSHDAIFLTRPQDGAVLAANPAACDLFGYSEQQLLSVKRDELLDASDPKFVEAWAERADAGAVAAELTFIRRDGTRLVARVSSKLFMDESGCQLACTIIHDVTERKQSEAALQQSEARFRLLYEDAPVGIILIDRYGRIVSANRKFAEIAGYASVDEIIGLSHEAVALPKERAEAAKLVETLLSGKTDILYDEGLLLRKDGSTTWVRVTARVLRDELGRPQWGIVIHEDISARKQTEEALRQSEERFRLLYENAPVGLIQTEENKGVASVNRKFLEITGYRSEEVIGRSYLDTAPPEDKGLIAETAKKLCSGEWETFTHERRMLRKDGTTIWVRVNGRLMLGKQGEPRTGLIAYEDITGKKQIEEALLQSEERFRLLYENAPIGIVLIDKNGVITTANQKFLEMTGYTPEEIKGMTDSQTTLPEDASFASDLVDKLVAGKAEVNKNERRWVCKDGSAIWIRLTATMMRDNEGKPQWGVALIENIAERKQTEQALRQSEEKFRATFEHAPLGIAECTVDGRFIEANAKLVEILGYTKDEMAHLMMKDVMHPSEVEKSLANLQKLANGEADSYVMEKRYIRKDRSLVWVNVTASLAPILGKPKHLVVMVEDITARKKAEEDLKRAMEWSYHQANHDMLTGLANRAAFHDRLKEALAYAKRDGHLVAVHLLDLDRFKSINDTLGHHIGDLLLQEVARRIKSHVRASDLAARLGGDEFAVIQSHLMEPAAAGILAGKLVEELGRKYVLEGQELHSGASIGIAVFPNDADNPEDLVRHADLALYEAKHRGRFNYQFYRKELGAAFHKAQRLEQELMRALRGNEFCLHYQPQFDLKSTRITGIEALLRWRHPARGMLPAAAFIRDAEQARLMPAIGEWTLQTACRQHKEWIDAGLEVPLTMNLSSMQLRDPRFLQMIKRILEETGLPAPLLQLEMRESALWDPKLSKSLLKEMKKSGLRLALDDFCADMAALSTLDRFPLDAVKPGQGLMRELPSQKREATLLAAIVGVAHNLKIAVCADGVETAGQLAAAKEQGCDSAQGNLLSSPLDAGHMKRLIEIELAH